MHKTLVGAAATVLLSTFAAQAADLPSRKSEPAPVFTRLPAVDGVNGKLEVFGGGLARLSQDPTSPFTLQEKWRLSGGAQGAVSFPLGNDFGVQLDGMVASVAGAFSAGAGAHAFWRDPSKGLLGVYGGGTYIQQGGGLGVGRVAAEAEGYFGRFTLHGVGGVEFGGRTAYRFGYPWAPAPGVAFFTLTNYSVKTRFFDHVSVAFYPVDDFKLSLGHRYTFGRHAATLGAEYLLTRGATAVSVFAEGRLGQRGASGVFGGLRVYFGQRDKTLINRHRQDDPINYQFDGAGGVGGGAPGGAAIPQQQGKQMCGGAPGAPINCCTQANFPKPAC